MRRRLFLTCHIFLIVVLSFLPAGFCWSNGGYSSNLTNPDYGTHDWIIEHALDWLPQNEKQYIIDNLALCLYGTELPDNGAAPDGIGDTSLHHIYYNAGGLLTDDSSAARAQTVFDEVVECIRSGEYWLAAKEAGVMSHYIADVAVFGHVMGSGTDWGAEKHHSDYENYVNDRTSAYNDEFNIYLSFDGELSLISAYDAACSLAYDTTFDIDGDLTAVWMDQNYNWSNTVFRERCGESLNLATNYIADVLHTIHIESMVWSGWNLISGGRTLSTLAATSDGNGLHVLVRGLDGGLYH